MSKTCVILQPSYIPWRGYFDLIKRSDVFVFYDDVQYDKQSWRNRNRIKTPQGSAWLTIPVLAQHNVSEHLLLKDVNICYDRNWMKKHQQALTQSYRKAPFFDTYKYMLEVFYDTPVENLVEYTTTWTMRLAVELGAADTQYLASSDMDVSGGQTERLVNIVKAAGCDTYLSGPAASDYLEEPLFKQAGITLEYMTYDYPTYEQLYPPFDPNVSVLDVLFMKGPDTEKWIWG